MNAYERMKLIAEEMDGLLARGVTVTTAAAEESFASLNAEFRSLERSARQAGPVAREPWYQPWPDLTTEAIIRIDAELEKTRQQRELLAASSLCLVCGETGMPHAHWMKP